MERKFDIEYLQLSLLENINILKCFDEFCEESVVLPTKDGIDRTLTAECFTKRMNTYRSLLNVAIRDLEENSVLLEEYLCSPASRVEV